MEQTNLMDKNQENPTNDIKLKRTAYKMPRQEQIAKPSKTSQKNPKQFKREIRSLEPEIMALGMQKSSDTNKTVKSKKSTIKSSKESDDIDSD